MGDVGVGVVELSAAEVVFRVVTVSALVVL